MATGQEINPTQPDIPHASTLNAQQAVLLFINTQNYYCGDSMLQQSLAVQQAQGYDPAYWAMRTTECKVRWQRLQQAARACGIEVVYVVTQSLTADGRDRSIQQKQSGIHIPPGSWDAQVVDVIPPGADEVILPMFGSGVFQSTPLDGLLRNMDKRFLIVAGCMTDECIDHAVRDACGLSYSVTLLTDCCAAPSLERHEQACAVLARHCRQQKLGALLQELVALAAKAVIAPIVTARPNSQAGVAPAAQPSSAAPVDLSGSRRRLFNIPELAVHQEPATVEHAPHAMLGSNPGFAAVHAAPSAAVAAGAAPVIQELPHSTFSEPEEAEQYNLDDFVPELQQHRVDERNHDSDGSGTDDLRADTAQQAMPGELIKHGSSKSANSGSSKRQTFKGRTTSPHSSRKEPRKMYFEYAKQQWETEGEFLLPNGETWVEVVVKGDPSRQERGLVFCKLCRHYDKSNTFGRGYRAGKRTALREHMQTKDHKELVKALEEGRIAMPVSTASVPAEQQQELEGQEPAELPEGLGDPEAAADEPMTAAAALMQLGSSASPEHSRGALVTPVTPSTLGGILTRALTAQSAMARTDAEGAASARAPGGSGRSGGVNRVVLAAAVAKIASAAGLSGERLAEVSRKLQQYLQATGDELTPEGAATAITVAFAGTAKSGLSADVLRKALASLSVSQGPTPGSTSAGGTSPK